MWHSRCAAWRLVCEQQIKGRHHAEGLASERTKHRLHNALLALDAPGITVKVGRGNATRRGLLR